MAFVVGGGDFPLDLSRARPGCDPPPCSWSVTKLGVGAWFEGYLALPPFSSSTEGKTLFLLFHIHAQIYKPSLALWPPARGSPFCSNPAKSLGSAACPLSGVVASNGALVACRKIKRVVRWVSWSVWFLGVEVTGLPPRMVVGVLGFSPELVPVVYSPFTRVGSSIVVLTVFWSAGVGSGRLFSCLFVSTGLLCGFSQGCHVIIIVECLRSSVKFGSFSIPKGVMELGLSLMPRGVTCVGPSGIIFLLTV